MLTNILLGGIIIGVVHFIILSALYLNPFVARKYKAAGETSPAIKKWPKQGEYILKMFLGTQVEIFILTAAYFFLRTFLPQPLSIKTAIILAGIFSAIRIYPRFWNMWIQSTYPGDLLAIEFINGIIGTYVIIIGLNLMPL